MYKNSITYNINITKNIYNLGFTINKFEKKFNMYKLNNLIKNKYKIKMNTSKFYDDALENLKKVQSYIYNIEDDESLESLLYNSLEKFNYKLDENFEDLKKNLLILIAHSKVIQKENKRYSFILYKMFETVKYHEELLKIFNQTKNDDTKELFEKGTAYSSNRNTDEMTQTIKNFLGKTLKIMKKNSELEGIINCIERYEKNPYDVIIYLNAVNENTFKYLTNESDKEIAETIFELKKSLNASQGLIESDFKHSMRFYILQYFCFDDVSEFGFSSKDKLKDLLNDILEEIIKIDYFRFDVRDFNQPIQLKDKFNGYPLIEKITDDNRKKHPIFDSKKLFIEMKKFLPYSLKKSQYKTQR